MSALALAGALAAGTAYADAGMWTFNNFPSDKVRQAYGFTPDQKWLDHVRLSSVRLARGCSASFVSPNGLIMTNHHCTRSCLEDFSSRDRDYNATGFFAKDEKEELKCQAFEGNQLIQITDVTARVKAATKGKDGKAFSDAKRIVETLISKECSGGKETLRCDVVELYHGGLYNLYKYRRLQDLRLVAAPEESIAFFGGDPDNFKFPRYDLDFSFLRVYEDGKPLDTSANYLPFAKTDLAEGDLTFVSGHPGSTSRLDTVAQLEYERDVVAPDTLLHLAEMRGLLEEFAQRGPEQKRIAEDHLFGIENSYKSRKGQFEALLGPTILKDKRREEADLRAKVDADPAMKAAYGDAWTNIAGAIEKSKLERDRFMLLETGRGFDSRLFSLAKRLVRYGEESGKPETARLREYTTSSFPMIRASMLSPAPLYPELETATFRHSLSLLLREFGPDDPLIRKIFNGKTPAELSADLIGRTGLADPALRRKLLSGGKAAIDASNDPMIQFARLVDPESRTARKIYEEEIGAVLTKNETLIAQARFQLYGTSSDPDATFTLRLSYGSVKAYESKGRHIAPFTTIGGAFERATGAVPFKLPESWIAAKPNLNLQQTFNIATTNDIIGGNSGSPLINKNAEVVGLIFDGNIESLGGDFWFDPAVNRAVSVDAGAIRESLVKIYRADRLVRELDGL